MKYIEDEYFWKTFPKAKWRGTVLIRIAKVTPHIQRYEVVNVLDGSSTVCGEAYLETDCVRCWLQKGHVLLNKVTHKKWYVKSLFWHGHNLIVKIGAMSGLPDSVDVPEVKMSDFYELIA